MTLEVSQSTQFVISDFRIATKTEFIDIRNVYEELNIFDSLLHPCVSGTVIIKDALGLIDKFLFDGTEILYLRIGKDRDNVLLEKKFRIYKLTDRKNLNQNTEIYKLHFISEEFILSAQQKISQVYETTYAEAAVKIINDYLKVPLQDFKGFFDKSLGVKKILVPNLEPIEALTWMSKKAVDENNFPGFLFFENNLGYNFVSLSTLFSQPSVAEINFEPKNLNKNFSEGITKEILGARSFEVIQQYDLIKGIRDGVYSGKFVGYDPVTRTYINVPMTFDDIYNYNGVNHLNKSPNIAAIRNKIGLNLEQHNSRIVTSPFSYFQRASEFIKENDEPSISKLLNTENYAFQRKAILSNLFNQRVKISVPGNFLLTSGFNVFLKVPKYSIKEKNEVNLDRTVYGNYLIVAARHIIQYDRHETVFEAVTDSSNRNDDNSINQSSTYQQE